MKLVNNFSRVLIVITISLSINLLIQSEAFSQIQTPIVTTNFWNSLDTYSKIVAGVVAAITAILGIPVAFLQIRKTIVEIRKIELETRKLQGETGEKLPIEYQGYQLNMSESDNNTVQIFVDPRFSAPLLILLDFVIVYIVLALSNYALNFFYIDFLKSIILPIVGVSLFVPLLLEAFRLRDNLRTSWKDETKTNVK
jgi:hypothetical protein